MPRSFDGAGIFWNAPIFSGSTWKAGKCTHAVYPYIARNLLVPMMLSSKVRVHVPVCLYLPCLRESHHSQPMARSFRDGCT